MPIPTVHEEVITKFRSLSASIRDFLSSAETSGVIIEIEHTYHLQLAATLRLSKGIAFFAMQFLSPQEFAAELTKIAPQGKLADLKRDVVAKVFAPYTKELHANGIRFEEIEKAEQPAPPAPVTVSQAVPAPVIPPKPPAPFIPYTPPAGRGVPPPASKIVVTPQAGESAVPAAAEVKKEEPSLFQPVRYTVPPQIPEVPKVIGATKPPPPPPITPAVPAITPVPRPITPVGQKPAEGPAESIIDLSTFQLTKKNPGNPPPSQAQTPKPMQNPPEPKTQGNTLSFK